jgi:iron complex transport system ATP-binding protein
MKLKVRGIEFAYRSVKVLRDIQFEVDNNEIMAIIGPNGVGNTTLLKCINGLLTSKVGTVMVDGEDLRPMKRVEVAKRIGYVPQRADVNKMTVFDSVLLGRKPHIVWDVSKKDIQIAEDMLYDLGLAPLSLKYIDEVSGGEFQKVQIARALVQQPKVLLLDEPTSSLDLCNQHLILETIRNVVKRSDILAIMTMHDLNLALRYADKFLMIKEGTILAAGGPEVVTPENIETTFNIAVDVTKFKGRTVVIPQ